MSTKTQIIDKFHLYFDDSSELSTAEESDLFDRTLARIYTTLPWEWLKKSFTGVQSTTVPYIALPTDFNFVVQNTNYTDVSNQSYGPAVLVGSSYAQYQIVSWSDRRQYRDKDGYAYIDLTDPLNPRLYFTKQPTTANSVEFDYASVPAALSASQSPVFPTAMATVGERAIFHGMCVDSFVIQQVDKAKSYANENSALYEQAIQELRYQNANLIQFN